MKRCLIVVLALGCAAGPTWSGNYFVTGLDQYGAPPNCGTNGQVLTGDGNCKTTWTTVGVPADTAYTDVNNNFSAVQTFPAGTASAPGISIGESNTGFYNSGSHQITFTSNGSARLDFAANGVGNFNTADSAGMFFSGADTALNCGGGGALIKFQEGNTGYLLMQLNAGTKQASIPAAGGLNVSYNVAAGSMTVTTSITASSSTFNTVSVSTLTVTGPGAPPDSKALCLLNGQLGHCTTVVGVTGGCTCVAP